MDAFELSYALAKQVPAMRTNVILDTDYGELVLRGDEAAKVAVLVERLLRAKLARLERGEHKADAPGDADGCRRRRRDAPGDADG